MVYTVYSEIFRIKKTELTEIIPRRRLHRVLYDILLHQQCTYTLRRLNFNRNNTRVAGATQGGLLGKGKGLLPSLEASVGCDTSALKGSCVQNWNSGPALAPNPLLELKTPLRNPCMDNCVTKTNLHRCIHELQSSNLGPDLLPNSSKRWGSYGTLICQTKIADY